MSKVHQKVSGRVQHMLETAQNARSDIGKTGILQLAAQGQIIEQAADLLIHSA